MRLYNLLKHYILTFKRYFFANFSLKSDNKGNSIALVPIIIGLISGTVMLSTDVVDVVVAQARDARRAADVYQVSTALAFYYDDHGVYPKADATHGWQVLEKELVPDYMQTLPQDPGFDQGFVYKYESAGQKAIVYYYSEAEGVEKERWSY